VDLGNGQVGDSLSAGRTRHRGQTGCRHVAIRSELPMSYKFSSFDTTPKDAATNFASRVVGHGVPVAFESWPRRRVQGISSKSRAELSPATS